MKKLPLCLGGGMLMVTLAGVMAWLASLAMWAERVGVGLWAGFVCIGFTVAAVSLLAEGIRHILQWRSFE